MRAVDNILRNEGHDIWAVNVSPSTTRSRTDADTEQPYAKLPTTVYETEPLVSNS